MISPVDVYFREATRWREESEQLRAIMLEVGLDEALKWKKPCFTFGDDNIAIIQPMKAFVALMFFKGALLKDPKNLLEKPGKNSRWGRRLHFTSVEEVVKAKSALKAFVREAIALEKSGATLPEREELVLVDELRERLDADSRLKAAFEGLTPGRQRGYNLYFSGAKQSETRARRVDKHVDRILAGKGLRDR